MKDGINRITGNVHNIDHITEHDIYLLKEGSHYRLYDKLGAHIINNGKDNGAAFAVWAPNAERVSVTGDFNGWNSESHALYARQDGSGIWEGFISGISGGDIYKYHIHSKYNNFRAEKGDPFAFYWEQPPKTASVVWNLHYEWNDSEWITNRNQHNSLNSPFSVYEVHLGSWRRVMKRENEFLTYREIAHELADYVKEMEFTHVELLPVTEHPFYGSWGYQTTGYFAPTSRYGSPQDFMYLVDYLHQNGIGVILDWVPSHFPSDGHGLAYFDGTHLYEHADPKMGFHPEWKSYIFNYSRNEVRAFLISSAIFWIEKYHIDALRVDAVASMLYLDYARKEGEWIPNKYGGHENLDAINLIKRLNEAVYISNPDVQMIAEESTSWPMVSRPTSIGGLGFGMKWNMGWMHDILKYFSKDPVYRKSHHKELTFSIWYAFSENFLLPLSHDEVVHGKGSLIGKMPGDEWQRHANLRILFGYMFAHPGKKLLFMGGEFAQLKEWDHDESLEWSNLQYPLHKGIQNWVKDLNRFYKKETALYGSDFAEDGFEWIDFNDCEHSIISFIRKDKDTDDIVLLVCNATPVPRHNYNVGVPSGGFWKETLNSDAEMYGGSGCGNFGGIQAVKKAAHGRAYSLSLTLPPLGILFFKNSN
ncbi:1,4-alpha-glucan branching protein GlgB [Candidatus Scalindua japonica]|nr:1,4-alpha-glucan branching protein GlgB [Candidatus Scalindua japonica]